MLLTISLSGLLAGQLKDDYVVSISSIRFFLEEENKFIHSLNTFSGTGYDGPLTWFSGESVAVPLWNGSPGCRVQLPIMGKKTSASLIIHISCLHSSRPTIEWLG